MKHMNQSLGEIWNILYSQTDVNEENLPLICETILIRLKQLGWKMNKEKIDLLFETFVGESVIILLDKEVEQTRQSETHIETLKSSLSVNGYIIDMDDDFVYLGYNPDSIAQAVKKSFIIHVEIANQEDELLSNIELPKDEKEYN